MGIRRPTFTFRSPRAVSVYGPRTRFADSCTGGDRRAVWRVGTPNGQRSTCNVQRLWSRNLLGGCGGTNGGERLTVSNVLQERGHSWPPTTGMGTGT